MIIFLFLFVCFYVDLIWSWDNKDRTKTRYDFLWSSISQCSILRIQDFLLMYKNQERLC